MTATNGFLSMPDRMHGEAAERVAIGERAIPYGNTFLDDFFLGLLPHDLVLLGAPSGLGKTQMALDIGVSNSMRGNATHYFALEAQLRELERRYKYALISREAHRCHLPLVHELRYRAWHMGRCEHIVGHLNAWADKRMREDLANMFTYYRGDTFTAKQLTREILNVHERSTLIIVDHLHYVDGDDGEDENRSLHETVKTVRDLVLLIGRPVILVAHLRKKDERARKLIPSLDDFHGTSNVTKIATQVITLERAHDLEPVKWYFAPTYVSIAKDRLEGHPREVAVMNFDKRTKKYAAEYTLGRIKGSKWESLGVGDAPHWATHHRPMTSEGTSSPQTPLPVVDAPHAATSDERRYGS